MSKVLYKRTGNPEKSGVYIVNDPNHYTQPGVPFLQRARFDKETGQWFCWWNDPDQLHPDFWYSETPPPELAEVIDAINRQKEYFTNQGDSVAILLKKHQIETLLNELLN